MPKLPIANDAADALADIASTLRHIADTLLSIELLLQDHLKK